MHITKNTFLLLALVILLPVVYILLFLEHWLDILQKNIFEDRLLHLRFLLTLLTLFIYFLFLFILSLLLLLTPPRLINPHFIIYFLITWWIAHNNPFHQIEAQFRISLCIILFSPGLFNYNLGQIHTVLPI